MSLVENATLKAVKYKLKAVDQINAASTTQTVPFHLPGADGYLLTVIPKVLTAFVGVTFPTMKVGVSNMDTLLVPDQPINKTGVLKAGLHQYFCQGMTMPGGSVADQDYQIIFTSTSENLSELTAGEIEFLIIYAV